MYDQTSIRGRAFMLGSTPVPSKLGDVMVVNSLVIPWGFTNASAAATTINNLPRGTITYVYQKQISRHGSRAEHRT